MSNTFISFDIEKAGCRIQQHPIVSIGYCVGDAAGNILEKDKINLVVRWPTVDHLGTVLSYNDFEQRCWAQFWSQLPKETIENLKHNAVSQEAGFWHLAQLLDRWEKQYPNIKFLGDNLSYDYGNLDFNLEFYQNRNPLRYSSTGKYRSILPADDLFETLPADLQNQLVKSHVDPFAKHDHDPANDAEYIYRLYVAYLHGLKQL